MIKRWLIYFNETVRVSSALVFAFLIAFTAHSLFQVTQGVQAVEFHSVTLFGALTYFLILLYNRVTDEFKDYEIDLKYFPDRPLPSGRVTLEDLTRLKEVVVVLLIGIHILYPKAVVGFLASFLYFYLIAIYFFTPKIHSSNRILAFITHTPAHIVLLFYVLSLLKGGDFSAVFTGKNLMLVLWVWFPLIIWEIARKTRAPEEEAEGYQTYSAMLGSRWTTAIIIAAIGIHFTLFCQSSLTWGISSGSFWAMFTLTALFLIIAFRFFLKPVAKHNQLKSMSELYNLLCYVLVIVNSFLFYGAT